MKPTARNMKTVLLDGYHNTISGLKRRWFCFFIILGVIALDQVTKFLAVTYLRPIRDIPLWDGVLHLRYTTNPGAAGGMLGDNRWVFLLISSLAIPAMFLYLFIRKDNSRLMDWGLSFIVGGGFGNMIDRVGFGFDPVHPSEVVDFIYFKLINFPIFNGADSFVCVGAGMVILAMLLDLIREGKQQNKEDTPC